MLPFARFILRQEAARSFAYGSNSTGSCALMSVCCCCTGVLTSSVQRLEEVCQSLIPAGKALTTVSAVRCLNVYLERLGALHTESSNLQDTMNRAFESGQFISIQPSLLAAVAYRAARERQGILPAWPTALAELTGWTGDNLADSDFDKALSTMRLFTSAA